MKKKPILFILLLGIFGVLLVPGIVSADKFSIGDYVRTTTNLNVRIGPGTSFDEITDPDYPGSAQTGTLGKVIDGPQFANSYTWWKINYGPGLYSGWSAEDWLEKVTLPATSGIDVSHHQGNIDWSQVYNGGYRFAFIKATQRDDYVDDNFITNINGASNANILAGPYHFACPSYNLAQYCYGTSAEVEAQHFLNVAGNYLTQGYLRPVLDIDQPICNDFINSNNCLDLRNWIDKWMEIIKTQKNIAPILYTGPYCIRDCLGSSFAKKYDLWIARYGSSPCPFASCDWGWDFWQYSDKGTVPGIITNVDLDLFNGDMARLNSFMITTSDNPPTCSIQLREKDTTRQINEINLGEWFDIYVNADDDGSIEELRFLSDENQNDVVDPGFTWTRWYDWDVSLSDWTGEWYADRKVKTWAFDVPAGPKEVWAEVEDNAGQTYQCNADIYAQEVPECIAHHHVSCFDNDVYWFDSCDTREEKRDECGISSCDAWGDSYCKDNDIYHSRTCFQRECRDTACFDDPYTEEEKVLECGESGYEGDYYCFNNDVYRNYLTRGCSQGNHCSSDAEARKQQECEEDYCESWSQNYCKDGDVWHSRTCYDKGCSDGSCFNLPFRDEKKLQDCEFGCENGVCLPPTAECTSGPCCDISAGKFRPSTYKCQEDVNTEYACPWGTGCGADIGVRHQDIYCSGFSAQCNGELRWDSWTIADDCDSTEKCVVGNPTCVSEPSCITCTHHSYLSCFDNDVYWFDSCDNIEDKEQECGENTCDAWGNWYCATSRERKRDRTCYEKGCSENNCFNNPRTESQTENCMEGQECQEGICITIENQPPTCSLSSNPESGKAPLTVTFSLSANDPDGSIAGWGLDTNGDGDTDYIGLGKPPSTISYTYNIPRTYIVVFIVWDDEGEFSEPCIDEILVNPREQATFIRGDTDGNSKITIGDGIQILERLFTGRQAFDSDCDKSGDVDDSGKFTIGDAVYLFNYMFAGGPEPKPPFPEPGVDPTPDELGCGGAGR